MPIVSFISMPKFSSLHPLLLFKENKKRKREKKEKRKKEIYKERKKREKRERKRKNKDSKFLAETINFLAFTTRGEN